MSTDLTRRLMTTAAGLYGLAGLGLLFLPTELGVASGASDTGGFSMAMWGAGLLGFAILNWTSRAAILGGIYGRPIVASNQMHAAVGVLVLLNIVKDTREPGWSLILALIVYVLAAVFYTALLTTSPKPLAESE